MQFKASDIKLIESAYNTTNALPKPTPSEFIVQLSSSGVAITKSNVLLAIIEIFLNYKLYNQRYSPCHKRFWYECLNSPLLSPILSKCTISSLRLISSLLLIRNNQINQISSLINVNCQSINGSYYNLFTLFKGLINCIKPKNSLKTFNEMLIETSYKLKIKPVSNQLKRARNKKKKYTKNHKQSTKKVLSLNREEDAMLNQSYWEQKIHPLIMNEKEWDSYQTIDEIIDCLQNYFPNVKRILIMNILSKNSMNIVKTYKILKGEVSEDIGFSSAQDYIIKKMKGTDIYDEIVKSKGEESIMERKRFLAFRSLDNYIDF